MSEQNVLEVTCPTCKKRCLWHGNATRPFCSERCKVIDLGAWASEDYKVPTNEGPSSDNSPENEDMED